MSLFDVPENVLPDWFHENFKEGEPFVLTAIRNGGTAKMPDGSEAPVTVLVIDGKEYGITGAAIVKQQRNAKRGELPAWVSVERAPVPGTSYEQKVLVPVEGRELPRPEPGSYQR